MATHPQIASWAKPTPLSELFDASRKAPKRLGIDGNYLLHELREWLKVKDPNWFLTAVVPATIDGFLDHFFAPYETAGWKVAVVFDGIPCVLQPTEIPDPLHGTSDIWSHVEIATVEAQTDAVKAQLAKLSAQEQFEEELAPCVARAIRKRKGKFCTAVFAPYLAWGQLSAWMFPQARYIHDVVGVADCLAFNFVDRVIVNVDSKGVASHVSKDDVEAEARKVVRIGVDDTQESIVMRTVVALSNQPHMKYSYTHLWPDRPAHNELSLTSDVWRDSLNFVEQVKTFFEQCPVLTDDGDVKSLAKFKPDGMTIGNLRSFFYNNLPCDLPLYHFCQFTGIISPAALSVLATAKIVDQAPLVDTAEYRGTLERIIPLRTQIVFQLIMDSPQVAYFKQHFQLQWWRTFITPGHGPNPTPILRPPEIKLDEWADVEDKTHTFVSVLEYEAKATQSTHYATAKQSLGAVLLKSLDLLGYFTHAAHANNMEVSSASVYATALKALADDTSLAESGVLLIELIRTKTLNDLHLTLAEGGGDFASRKLRLPVGARTACRVLALVPITVNGAWTGIIDPEVTAFTAVVRAFQRSLRSLTEVIATMLWVSRTNKCHLGDFVALADELPFAAPVNCYGALIAHFALTNENYQKAKSADERLAVLSKSFPCCPNLRTDVKRMASFWRSAENVMASLIEEEDADATWSSNFDEIARHATGLVNDAFGCFL